MKLNKLSILDKCAKIATISTCILNANDNRDKSETLIQLTDDSLIETIYHYSVYDSPDVTKPLDVHSFEINFYRNGEFIDHISFGTYGDAYTSGSLCDKNKDLQFRMEWLKTAKPDIFLKAKVLTNWLRLTDEEITALEEKADELETIANNMYVDEMLENKKTSR